MDVHQLRSWVFELYDPLTEDRTYILFEQDGALLVDMPPYTKRSLSRILGTCDPAIVFFTHAGRAQEIERWRAALPKVRFAIHEADAAAVPGKIDLALEDGAAITHNTTLIHTGAHTPGASAVLARLSGGVLFTGDAVVGAPDAKRLRLPGPSYAPPEKVHAAIEKLRPLEFSAVLSTRGRPVWSAGKEQYLELLDELPRPRKAFGHLVDAPWDSAYRGRLEDQMLRNPIMPTGETIEEAAAHGPSTLIPVWERRPARPVAWLERAVAAGAAPPVSGPDGQRWTLAREGYTDLPAPPRGPVQTVSGSPDELPARYRRLEASELLEIPQVDHVWHSLDLSPDGAQVTFAWDQSGSFEIYRAPLDSDAIYQLTSGRDRCLQPRWSPDGRRIAYLRDRAGDERWDIWLVDPRGERHQRLTDDEHTRYSLSWSPDGRHLAYLSDEGGDFALWTVDVHGGERRQLVSPIRLMGGGWTVPRWSPDGRFIAFHNADATDPRNADIYLVPAAGGAAAMIETHQGSAQSLSPAWSPDGRWLALTTDERGRYEIVTVPMRDGTREGPARHLRAAHFDEIDPQWTRDGRGLLYRRLVEGATSVRRVFLPSQNDEPLLDAPGTHFDVREREDGGLIFTWSGARFPADVYVRARGDVVPRAITRSLPPGLDPAALVSPRHVRYPGADGDPIPALLYVPHPEAVEGEGPPPAVVYVHGGPTGQHALWWDANAQWFANRGYVVIAPNVRGSTGYGRAFREANRGDWGGKDLEDAVKAADWLEREGIADGARIAVYGGSYGGYMTLMALTHAPRRWAAGCSLVGITSLETLYRTTRGDLRTVLEAELGTPERDAALFRQRSPIRLIDRITAPVLILQGKNDPRVPLAEAEQVVAQLRKAGRAFAYHVYEDEGHGFRRMENRRDALTRVMEFFDEHVKARKVLARS